MESVPTASGDLAAARERLMAASRAHVGFAERNPGLDQAIFVSSEQIGELTTPVERSRGAVSAPSPVAEMTERELAPIRG